MGRSIEDIIQGLRETYVICRSVYAYDRKKYIDGAIDRLSKYQMLKADYENRLKADIEAILVELQLEVEESENCGKAFHLGLQMASNIIQQKINKLKGDQEGEE